ncbi:MAG: 6 7-dimethyl-8-ribityllumazine [Prolixibacteraceae bacterium]|nr:MAG: 6 7-dimethyl-8-ribityllumazine [Prolixibacteraceae bacterium]
MIFKFAPPKEGHFIYLNMATKDFSQYDISSVPSASRMRFGIVAAEWNPEITLALTDGAVNTLKKHGAGNDNIVLKFVPGSFELPLGAQFLAEYENVDAVIVLGCVIQGETRHFEYICEGVAQGIKDLNLKYNKPFIFGLLTTLNHQQALDRAGGKHGNKGDEAAVTAIKMVHLKNSLQ